MERINSNTVDVYHPDIYCPAEKYKGVNYPGAYLGERIINLNGCEGREEGQYGISMRRCGLTGWSEPKYYCTSSISNLNTVFKKSASDTIDNEKYEFAYNTHKGPMINNTFVYNNIHQRGGEDLLNYYNDIITTSNTDLIYEPERYCKINYNGYDMYINNNDNRIYAFKNSNDKYMYVTCNRDDDGTNLNIIHEGTSNIFEVQCDGKGWAYSTPIYKRTCKAGTQYGYCKGGSIENINEIVCGDLDIENDDGKDENGNNWWIWILLIVIVIIVIIIIVVIVMRKNKNSVKSENKV